MDSTTALILIIVFLLGLLGLSIRASMWLARRSICRIISDFQERGAVRYDRAQTLQEMGMADRPMITFFRDYRPYAFQFLAQSEIIQPTPDGRFFLDERNLDKLRGRVDCI